MADNPNPPIVSQQRFVSGESDFPKEGLDQFVYQDGISIDHRHDPRAITLLPKSLKESGSIVTDLPKWAAVYPTTIDTYIYGNTGNIYKRTTAPVYSLLHKAPSSHGNGLFYYPEDDYLYYTSDNQIGRYGPISLSNPQFVDNFLTAQGGVPTNVASVSLASASSQYATHVDAGNLDITSDISMGVYVYPTTLPTAGNSMTLISKWDENASHRSYKFGIGAISAFFGSGTDGALTISSDTTEAPIDSACTGTAGTQTLTATNTSFASGQVILIHQSQGSNAGQWERNTIQGYTAGTITLGTSLMGTYTTGAQVRVLKQYSSVTINSGKTYTAKAWTGTVGGILAFLCSGTVTVTGSISGNSCGFRGGTGAANNTNQTQGEGSAGVGTLSNLSNGNGGGTISNGEGGGASGGNGTSGGSPTSVSGSVPVGGDTVGSNDLTTALFGGGGGGARWSPSLSSGALTGGNGGGLIFITAVTLTVAGTITSTGAAGSQGTSTDARTTAGGSGAGGSILLKAQTATLGTGLITAGGGSAYSGLYATAVGGDGRVVLDYLTSYTGTTTPTLNPIQDSSLVTTTTYQLQFSVSSNGTTSETLTQNVNLQTSTWQQVAVSWAASSSTATFYLNSVSLGMSVGTRTSINNNASVFAIGSDKGASAFGNFYNGLLNGAMLLNQQTTSAFWFGLLSMFPPTNATGLVTLYEFQNNLTDSTSNAYNLTGVNSPTYSNLVPFAGATTRLDIDQTQVGTGHTYTLPTTIMEDAADEISFTPSRDPQKSIQVNIAAVGTGNWTVTVHDSANHLVTSVTYANATLHTGDFEFVFPTPWRVLTNFTNTYHVHFTSTVADGTITTGTADNLSTAGYTTYFSFLVTDTDYHPISQMLNQMVVGNERYVATYNGLPASYNPNTLVLPAAWRVRCFALWNEYLAIGCWRGNSITDFDQGRIYFWDGSALTFNFFIDVPEGGVNALLSRGSTLYAWCGYTGYLFEYQTGLDGDKIKRVPHILESDICEIFPGAVATWRTLVRFGVGGNVTSSTINRGVYSWGSFLTMGFFQQLYRDSLSFDYPISTGNYGSTVSIGLTQPVQNQLLIGWQDGINYGIDNVSFDNAPSANGSISLLVSDDNDVYKQKNAEIVVVQHLPLLSGESIRL